MRYLFIILFFILLTDIQSETVSDDTVVDSLEQLLSKSAEDTNKVIVLYNLCCEVTSSGYNKALDYGRQALMLSSKLNYKKGEAYSLYHIAGVYNYYHSANRAVEYFNESIKVFKNIGHSLGMAVCYGDIASVYESGIR
ncbi:MAG: hypothetical protein HY738_05100 [Bacteroidia bacterium]|nr:hypothetical protein [Bacteroidia bacterium]